MPNFSGLRCLVVDDEPRLRRVLVRLLEGEGFGCAEAASGVEALQELERAPVPLVISDLRMPAMDGVTLLREIIARWPETAVIDRKSTRLNSSHTIQSRMPSSA